ncbi:MAG: pilus assembly protein TadG-related protein [Candidatus Limnocylindrales bacterium]
MSTLKVPRATHLLYGRISLMRRYSSPMVRCQQGQTLPIVVGGLVALLALVALVIDGGNAWAQQRNVQNATDASAEAGATVLAKMWAQQGSPGWNPASGWDSQVAAAIEQFAVANDLPTPTAYYTDVCGTVLKDTSGNPYVVGQGMPPNTGAAWPSTCPSSPQPGPPSGVLASGSRQFHTYLAGAVGITTMTARASATAVSGFVSNVCSAAQGCALLPIVIPVFVLQCASNGKLVAPSPPVSAPNWTKNTPITVPLCQNGPGDVGWLNWGTGGNNGANNIVTEIQTPNNPPIPVPSWVQVAQTGNLNGGPQGGVETAIRAYDGQVVLIPMFDNYCTTTPNPISGGLNACPNGYLGAGGNGGGSGGTSLWYHLSQFAAFRLCNGAAAGGSVCGNAAFASYGAYIQGNNSTVCAAGGGGGTGCLAGVFENYVTSTTVVMPPTGVGGSSTTSLVGVQLIH